MDRIALYKIKHMTTEPTSLGMERQSRGGLFNQSATGDHDYECIVEVTNEPIRRRNVTIQGNIILLYNLITIKINFYSS